MDKIVKKTFEQNKNYGKLESIENFKNTLSNLNSDQVLNLNMRKLGYLLENQKGDILFWAELFLEDLIKNTKEDLWDLNFNSVLYNNITKMNIPKHKSWDIVSGTKFYNTKEDLWDLKF